MGSARPARWLRLALLLALAALPARRGSAASAEVKVDKDFLSAVVEKLPPRPFHKDGLYRGTIRDFRLAGIDPKGRRFLIACRVEGEYRPTISRPFTDRVPKDDKTPAGWRHFTFDVKASANIEAGDDGLPKFRVKVEEVKRRELEGVTGTILLALGGFFDEMVTGLVSGRAALMSDKLNTQVVKKVAAFEEFGVLSGIDYDPSHVTLRFDATRFRAEGVVGHLYPDPRPGTVPLTRWMHRRLGCRFYTTDPVGPNPADFRPEGVAGHVLDRPAPGTLPVYRWHRPRDFLYTTAANGEGAARRGYRPEGVSFYLLAEPAEGTVPLYRFLDPKTQAHFYTKHPHAEFAK